MNTHAQIPQGVRVRFSLNSGEKGKGFYKLISKRNGKYLVEKVLYDNGRFASFVWADSIEIYDERN